MFEITTCFLSLLDIMLASIRFKLSIRMLELGLSSLSCSRSFKGRTPYVCCNPRLVQNVTSNRYCAKSNQRKWLSGLLLPTESVSYPKVSHIGLDLVLGHDEWIIRTFSSTEFGILTNILDEAKGKSCGVLEARCGDALGWTEEELEQTAEAIGYSAVKYVVLKNNRLTNYTYVGDKMLSDKGNTAVYLQYAHARIYAIIRNSGRAVEELKQVGRLNLDHQNERILGFHLLEFQEEVEEALEGLLPSMLCK